MALDQDFEILVYDDGSSHPLVENEQINRLENCKYIAHIQNKGRSAILEFTCSFGQI